MGITVFLLIFGSFCVLQVKFLEASYYECGIRKHSFVQLVHHGWKVEEGQWPWHVALFHKSAGGSVEYACGATLLDRKHILTAAHCVVNPDTQYPMPPAKIELHFGQQNLSEIADHTQIRDVSKVRVHPEHSTHQNDVAVLVVRLPVEYTDFVIPICMDQRADRDLGNLEGKRGWITGWGTTQTGTISDVLWTASMPVVSYLQCFSDDTTLFGNILNQNVFCAGDRNGTSPGTGDSGGGMYFSDGDRWVLRGVVSFARLDELNAEVDTSKYTVFVNVQRFLTWIREIIDEAKPEAANRPKRISERECDRFKALATKRKNGLCDNSRHPHTVSIINLDGRHICTGALINENHVLTACICERRHTKVQIDAFGLIDVQNATCHENRLAIFKLNSSIDLSSSLIPACLASNWTENFYDTLIQAGFGRILKTGIKKYIESDDNKVITKEECERRIFEQIHYIPEWISNGQLCVINNDRIRNRTFDTPGSHLQSTNSRTCMSTLVGLNSFVDQYDESYYANKTAVELYTRISHYLDWIENIVWNEKPPTTITPRTITSSAPSVYGDFVFPDD